LHRAVGHPDALAGFRRPRPLSGRRRFSATGPAVRTRLMAEALTIRWAETVQRRRPTPSGGLGKRVLSALVPLPAFLAIGLAGPRWLSPATVVAVSAAGQWEFTGMFHRAGVHAARWVALLGGVAVTASFALAAHEGPVFTAVLLAVCIAVLWRPEAAPI